MRRANVRRARFEAATGWSAAPYAEVAQGHHNVRMVPGDHGPEDGYPWFIRSSKRKL